MPTRCIFTLIWGFIVIIEYKSMELKGICIIQISSNKIIQHFAEIIFLNKCFRNAKDGDYI